MAAAPGGVVDFAVDTVRAGDRTAYDGGVLTVELSQLRELVLEDARITDVQVEVVAPGDETRLIHTLDVVQPVCNADGLAMGAFPGMVSPLGRMGQGVVHRLRGAVVTAVGLLAADDSFFTQQEGILDMSGAGAGYSPLADVHHVVLHVDSPSDLANVDRVEAYQRATLLVAERLAASTLSATGGELAPGSTAVGAGSPELPRIAHICEVSSFGGLFDTSIAGQSAWGQLPTFVTPRNLAEGVVVSADYHYAGQRNLTCFYQDDPITRTLLGEYRDRLAYAGTILLPVRLSNAEKERGATHAANLAAMVGADGAIVTAVAGGNAHLDVMFAVRACEQRGIRTALSLVEMAGPDGEDPGMVDTVPEADLMISVGNREEIVALPPCANVLGGDRLIDPATARRDGADAHDALHVPLRALVGVNNELGAWRLGARAS